jgi:hypothetical protein
MTDRAALTEHVERSWDELQRAVAGLDDRQLTAQGSEGWSAKDHLVHLSHWLRYLLAVLLEEREPLAAIGLEPGQERDEDAENAVLQRRDASLPLAEVRRQLDEAHAAVLARVRVLSDADLERWTGVIEGNTWEHYDEHRAWIGGLVANRS